MEWEQLAPVIRNPWLFPLSSLSLLGFFLRIGSEGFLVKKFSTITEDLRTVMAKSSLELK